MKLRKIKPSPIKGGALRVAVSIGARFSSAILLEVDAMIKDAESEVRELFESGDYAGSYGMDGNIGSRARITLNKLRQKWSKIFSSIAGSAVNPMIEQVSLTAPSH